MLIDMRRDRLAVWARWLLIATVTWNTIEAGVAVGAGVTARSIALVGFGLDSLVEVFAAGVVLWQMRNAVSETRERTALRLIGWSFFVLAAYVTIEAVRDLAVGTEPRYSLVGIVLAGVSLIVMPVLALAKRTVGERLGSPTLVAESAETILCAALSLVVLVGLLLDRVGWSWADPIAALIIAGLAIREGRRALAGDTCCGS